MSELELAALYRLQEIETRLRELKEKRQTDDLVVDRERLRSAIDKYGALAAAAERKLKQQQLETRQAEASLASTEAELEKLETKLYQGEVTQPKELSRTEERLESLRGTKASDEERVYSLYEANERLQGQIQRVRDATAELERQRAQVEQRLAEREADWAFEEEELEFEWNEVRAQVSDTLFARYQRLSASTNLQPVAKVSHGVCGGCRTELPAALRSNRRTLAQCDRCGRLLYWP